MSEVNSTWIDSRGEVNNPGAAGTEGTAAPAHVSAPASSAAPGTYVSPTPVSAAVQAPAKNAETPETRKMRENFSFFGPVTFLYALLYAFCMYQNGSGITFPFFMAGSLLYFCFSLSKLELILKKGSIFYMISMMLLAVSTFCTDDGRIIAFNKTGIFLLMMSLLLKQFYDTSRWRLGKYLGSILEMTIMLIGKLGRPFADGRAYFKNGNKKVNRKIWYVFLGILTAVPLLFIVVPLLSSADAVFREVIGNTLRLDFMGDFINILLRIAFIFFLSYALLAYMCTHAIKEEVKTHRTGEPLLAITVTGILSLIYALFSGIQIIYLFLGNMQLPEGYTYAEYAREGFFQLLIVSILNLIIVLVCLAYFKESKGLKFILTIMSLCTFVMIASSAMRMIIYIRCYNLTFLRLLVLWALALLTVLFMGIVVNIYKESFGLFRYSMIVVTVLYLALSYSHPDYIIARVNVAKALEGEETDYAYLSGLCADAAPVIIPYLKNLGYDFDVFYPEAGDDEDTRTESSEYKLYWNTVAEIQGTNKSYKGSRESFGYYFLWNLKKEKRNFGLRTFNVSRYMAFRQVEKGTK